MREAGRARVGMRAAHPRVRALAGAGLRALATGIMLLAWPSAAHAFQADTLRLNLEGALRTAETGNPAYRRTGNALALNPVESRAVWLGELVPQVGLSLFNTSYSGNLQRIGQDNLGNPIQNPTADWVYFSNTSQALQLSWSFQGRSLLDAHRRQTLANRERVLASGAALSELQIEVRRRYMDALEQRELARAEEELIAARELDRDVAERLFSLAMRTRVDVLNAELAIEQQMVELGRQRSAYEQAVLALRTSLGVEGPSTLALEDEPLPLFDPSVLDEEALVRRAFESNPSLRQSEVAVRQADVTVSEQRNRWWPQVEMSFNVFRRTQEPNRGGLFDLSFDQDLERNFMLRLSLPIFNNFFQNRQTAEQAAVELDNRREADREERLVVEESVRSARIELESQWETLRLAERSHQIAGEALRMAREEYRLGTRSFEDLRASFDQEADTRRQVITARYAFVDALLDLEEAVGEPVRPVPGVPDPDPER